MKKLKINLKPDENNEFNAKVIDDGIILQNENISKDELSNIMKSNFSEDELNLIRTGIKLFKVKDISISKK